MKKLVIILALVVLFGIPSLSAVESTVDTDSLTLYGYIGSMTTPDPSLALSVEASTNATTGINLASAAAQFGGAGVTIGTLTLDGAYQSGSKPYALEYGVTPLVNGSYALVYSLIEVDTVRDPESIVLSSTNNFRTSYTPAAEFTSKERSLKMVLTDTATGLVNGGTYPQGTYTSNVTINLIAL